MAINTESHHQLATHRNIVETETREYFISNLRNVFLFLAIILITASSFYIPQVQIFPKTFSDYIDIPSSITQHYKDFDNLWIDKIPELGDYWQPKIAYNIFRVLILFTAFIFALERKWNFFAFCFFSFLIKPSLFFAGGNSTYNKEFIAIGFLILLRAYFFEKKPKKMQNVKIALLAISIASLFSPTTYLLYECGIEKNCHKAILSEDFSQNNLSQDNNLGHFIKKTEQLKQTNPSAANYIEAQIAFLNQNYEKAGFHIKNITNTDFAKNNFTKTNLKLMYEFSKTNSFQKKFKSYPIKNLLMLSGLFAFILALILSIVIQIIKFRVSRMEKMFKILNNNV